MPVRPRLLLVVATAAAAAARGGAGADGPRVAPAAAAPFRVVWNSPWPLQCYTFCHVDPPSLNLSAYSIEANGVNGNGSMSSESGGVLTLWDEYLGLYPSHRSLTLGPLHGGVPQLAVQNLSAHLAKLTSDVNAGLHNPRNGIMIAKPLPPDFSGIAVLDWEAWPFTWSRFGLSGFTPGNSVYMNTSVELVLADHPTWSPAKAEAEAARRWDAASRTFVEATLSTLHALRPEGKFGFFGWPDCDGHLTADGEPLGCAAGFRAMNDNDLGWLWNASSALFPSTCTTAFGPLPRRILAATSC
jgi:hyaluronoglucosaminidase